MVQSALSEVQQVKKLILSYAPWRQRCTHDTFAILCHCLLKLLRQSETMSNCDCNNLKKVTNRHSNMGLRDGSEFKNVRFSFFTAASISSSALSNLSAPWSRAGQGFNNGSTLLQNHFILKDKKIISDTTSDDNSKSLFIQQINRLQNKILSIKMLGNTII